MHQMMTELIMIILIWFWIKVEPINFYQPKVTKKENLRIIVIASKIVAKAIAFFAELQWLFSFQYGFYDWGSFFCSFGIFNQFIKNWNIKRGNYLLLKLLSVILNF